MTGHKAFFKQFVHIINTADENLAQQLISPKAQFHLSTISETLQGPKGYLKLVGIMRAGFSDMQWKLEEIVSEKDHSAIRYTMRGTHDGTFLGIPPTGKHICIQACNFYRLANNQIIEEYVQPDLMNLIQQIGVVEVKN